MATAPLPSGPFIASFASAPPVNGSPLKLRPSTTASNIGQSRRVPDAATTPTARNIAPFTNAWCERRVDGRYLIGSFGLYLTDQLCGAYHTLLLYQILLQQMAVRTTRKSRMHPPKSIIVVS